MARKLAERTHRAELSDCVTEVRCRSQTMWGRPRIVWVAYAGPNHSLLTWEGDSELLRSAYLADSPFSWAHIVILAIDAAGHGVDTTWAPVDPYGPFETAFETIR